MVVLRLHPGLRAGAYCRGAIEHPVKVVAVGPVLVGLVVRVGNTKVVWDMAS